MSQTAQNANELIEDFNSFSLKERLGLLLEFSEQMPGLPARYEGHLELLERVEECQSPVYVFAEVKPDDTVDLFFSAPAEAPTTRGFASILNTVLNGHSADEILAFDDDFPNKLGLSEAISPLRLRGMRGILGRIKRQIREKRG